MINQRLHLSTLLTTAGLALGLGACGTPSANDDATAGSTTSTTTTITTTDADAESGDTDPESATGETETSGFIPEGDTGGTGCGAECDIWENDCADGEKCTAVACDVGSSAWDSNVCVDVGGEKLKGDTCSGAGVDGLDDCASGLLCWDADADTGFGTCVEFCAGTAATPTCGSPDELCAIVNGGVLPICLTECDPLAPACPTSNNLCLPNTEDNGFICVLDASGEGGGYASPCEFANACDIGLLCIDAAANPDCGAGSTGCCSEMCEVGAANNCSGAGGGQQCEAFYADGTAPPGYDTVGICAIPQ